MTHQRTWQMIAGFSGFMGVCMGAVASHAMSVFSLIHLMEEGVFYQLLHAPVLLWLSDRHGRFFQISRWCFFLGTMLFSGSLYVKALTAYPHASMLAPFGGTLLMAGWVSLALAGRKYT